ncbi:MAG: 2Fe-2S ferredoxin [Planctomycetota bacterium]|jgi:2Fe-2S ferredoxin
MSGSFKVTFNPGAIEVEVDSTQIPYQRDGAPGSILDIALGNDNEIDHACGGVNACSTCHVRVTEGFDSLCEISEQEEDMLDNAPGVTEHSRLACQAVPNGSCNLTVEIPSWNRNHASETH